VSQGVCWSHVIPWFLALLSDYPHPITHLGVRGRSRRTTRMPGAVPCWQRWEDASSLNAISWRAHTLPQAGGGWNPRLGIIRLASWLISGFLHCCVVTDLNLAFY